jgi:hypothetical protein
MAEQSEELKRALGYPYAIPSTSYALAAGRAVPFEAVDVDPSTRTPLLAYGSNAAPEALARKLGPNADPVPVARVALRDFDVVYSAHVSAYGAVPATLQGSPGTEVSVFLAQLTEEQLRRLSETEPNYELRSVAGARLRCAEGEAPSEAAVYISRHGCLALAGREVALSSIAAEGRRFPQLSEPEVLERVRRELCPERTIEELVGLAAADPDVARRWTESLRTDGAIPLREPPAPGTF